MRRLLLATAASLWAFSAQAQQQFNFPPSYRAVTFGNTAYATPTDLACLVNPATTTKTIYVTQFGIFPQQTSLGLETFLFLKRSTLNSGGTSGAATPVAFDSRSATPQASLVTYTVAPTSLGTLVGTLFEAIENSTATTSGATLQSLFTIGGGGAGSPGQQVASFPGTQTLTQPITLHAGEEICVNFNSVALPSGFTAGYLAEWAELASPNP